MAKPKKKKDTVESYYLTPPQVSKRWRVLFNYRIRPGTLANWRSKKTGPKFVKPSKAIFYQLDDLRAWERKNGLRQQRHPVAND